MKKLMNKNRIIAILSVFMVLVFAVALLAQVRWEKVFAAIEYARDYTELADDELDDLSLSKDEIRRGSTNYSVHAWFRRQCLSLVQ